MRRVLFILVILTVCGLPAVFAGGGQEREHRNQKEEPQALAEAKAMPVADISGYSVRTAAWWNGPDDLTEVGRETLKLIDAVEKKHDVKMEWLQLPNPRALQEKMVATILLGEPLADMIYIESSSIPSLVESNMILPLDDYIDFSDPKWTSLVRYKGKVYGYSPFKLGGGDGIWYNKTLFQREGLPDLYELQEKGEWTWEKYFEIARAATKDTDGDGNIDQWGLTLGYEIEYPLIWSNGGRVLREENGKFRFTMDEPAVIEALEFIGRIYRENISTTQGESVFIAGRAAMYGGALFQGNHFMQNMQDEYGWVFYPKGPRMDDYVSMGGSGAVIIFPANLNYPPERLGKIAEEIIPFHKVPRIQQEFFEGQVTSQNDINTIHKMMERGGTTWKDSFPGLLRVTGNVFRKIRRGASAATAVQENMLQGQSAIDALFK